MESLAIYRRLSSIRLADHLLALDLFDEALPHLESTLGAVNTTAYEFHDSTGHRPRFCESLEEITPF